jgi:hypothetical protein
LAHPEFLDDLNDNDGKAGLATANAVLEKTGPSRQNTHWSRNADRVFQPETGENGMKNGSKTRGAYPLWLRLLSPFSSHV